MAARVGFRSFSLLPQYVAQKGPPRKRRACLSEREKGMNNVTTRLTSHLRDTIVDQLMRLASGSDREVITAARDFVTTMRGAHLRPDDILIRHSIGWESGWGQASPTSWDTWGSQPEKSTNTQVVRFKVDQATCAVVDGPDGLPVFEIIYIASDKRYFQTLRPEGSGGAPGYYRRWWARHAPPGTPVPPTAPEAYTLSHTLRWPSEIEAEIGPGNRISKILHESP